MEVLSIFDLPDEVLVRTFMFLDLKDLACLPCTNRKIYQLAQERLLWKKFHKSTASLTGRHYFVSSVSNSSDVWKSSVRWQVDSAKQLAPVREKWSNQVVPVGDTLLGREDNVLVFDIGSYALKIGNITMLYPSGTIPSIVGTPKYPSYMIGFGQKLVYLGNGDLDSKRGVINAYRPIHRGMCTDYEKLGYLMHHSFYVALRKAPEESLVFLSEPFHRPMVQKEKMMDLMFEELNVQGTYVAPSGLLSSVYCAIKDTGLVVEIGDGVTQVVPVIDGKVQLHLVVTENIGGYDITTHFINQLNKRGLGFDSSVHYLIADALKPNCYVSQDFTSELTEFKTKPYDKQRRVAMPDGNFIDLEDELITAPEVLFKPELAHLSTRSIVKLIEACLNRCDASSRPSLLGNICITGGVSACTLGLGTRLENELKQLYPSVPVIVLEKGRFAAWSGGAMMARRLSTTDRWVTRPQYQEVGHQIARMMFI